MSLTEPKFFTERFFKKWFSSKLKEYEQDYPEGKEDPMQPPRKGVFPGQPYPLSLAKYAAVLCCVLYGRQLPLFKIKLRDIADFLQPVAPVSYGSLRLWRSEKRFKHKVNELREDFASHYVREAYQKESTGLQTRIEYLRLFLTYPTELMDRIANIYYHHLGKRGGSEKPVPIKDKLYKYLSTCKTWSYIDDYEELHHMRKYLDLVMDEDAIDQKDGSFVEKSRFDKINEIITSEIRGISEDKNEVSIEDICYVTSFMKDYIHLLSDEIEDY